MRDLVNLAPAFGGTDQHYALRYLLVWAPSGMRVEAASAYGERYHSRLSYQFVCWSTPNQAVGVCPQCLLFTLTVSPVLLSAQCSLLLTCDVLTPASPPRALLVRRAQSCSSCAYAQMGVDCQALYMARSSHKRPIAGVNVTLNVSVRSRDPSQLAANLSAGLVAHPLPVPLQQLGEQVLQPRFSLDLWMPAAPLLVDASASGSSPARHTSSFSARRLVNFLSVATADECAPASLLVHELLD